MSIDDDVLGYLKSSTYRMKVLKKLKEGFATPSDISSDFDVKLSQISRTLSELEKMGLIMCTTPQRRKGRIYRISEKGLNILRECGELGNEK